ncbi:MAG: hypothetical protein V7752_06375 [Halopseudomonas sp.]
MKRRSLLRNESTTAKLDANMNIITLLTLQTLLIPTLVFACPAGIDCNKGGNKQSGKQTGKVEAHQHNNPQHRLQVILHSHEFAGKTCSYDSNCATGYKCDLRRGYHKGVCVHRR